MDLVSQSDQGFVLSIHQWRSDAEFGGPIDESHMQTYVILLVFTPPRIRVRPSFAYRRMTSKLYGFEQGGA
jgi:hypothetical protein